MMRKALLTKFVAACGGREEPEAVAVRIVVPLEAMRTMPLKAFKRALQQDWSKAREEILAARSYLLRQDGIEKGKLPPIQERRIITP